MTHRSPGQKSSLLVVPEFTTPGARTPARSISLTPKVFLPPTVALSKVFVGIALKDKGQTKESVVVITDGRSVIRREHSTYGASSSFEFILNEILDKIRQYAQARSHKVEMIALSPLPPSSSTPSRSRPQFDDFIDRTWLVLDALPFLASSESASGKFSLDGQAVAAIEEAVNCLEVLESSTVRIQFDQQRRVLVDADGRVQLHSMSLLKRISSSSLFSTFQLFSEELIRRKVKVGFFSATPRGGGVALMRHSIMRLFEQVGVDASWYVPPGDSNVFNVTKRKFHNVLQGVAPPTTILTQQDEQLFEDWTDWYLTTLWMDKNAGDGSEFLSSFDVIVIDDPQVVGLIPYIRKLSPRTKIIYRSHIQIRADLIDRGVEQQKTSWDFLFERIRQVDLFVAHPLEEFVPQIVKDTLPVAYMPPCTAPLDGLNKPIPSRYEDFYRRHFGLSSQSALGREVDWSRGYILQIARFDPSKGIPDLVEAYRLFRIDFSQHPLLGVREPPQLLLTGHSSIDDPDAVNVLKSLYEQLSDPLFDGIRHDIFAVRAPSSDRLFNTILRGSDVVCQVSTREGYEIKVTEAISKGKWIIGTKAGGIPLQIRDGIDGRLVEPHDPHGISNALIEFYDLRKDQTNSSVKNTDLEIQEMLASDSPVRQLEGSDRHSTLANSTMWEFLFLRLLSKEAISNGTESGVLNRFGFVQGVKDLNEKRVWDSLEEAINAN
ncbi:uncharacterized protein JCM6883_003301 [Sporobolomyces salmoneus]|uniref:uncharacterized protein n=1 Tax=Sporobolomyces salmoneus TaxID=183962 RepID=UPI0031823A6B